MIQNPDFIFFITQFILSLMLILSAALLKSRSLVNSIIYMTLFSLLSASSYLLMGAPDVALTEAAVGACISTIFVMASLSLVGEKQENHFMIPFWSLSIVLSFLTILAFGLWDLPIIANATNPANLGISGYYITNTMSDIGLPSMVAAILASYRGFDTLGETLVILVASLSVYLILDQKPGLKKK